MRPWYDRAALLIPRQCNQAWQRLKTLRRTPDLRVPTDAYVTVRHHGRSSPSHHKDGPVVLAFRPSNYQLGSVMQFADTVADGAQARCVRVKAVVIRRVPTSKNPHPRTQRYGALAQRPCPDQPPPRTGGPHARRAFAPAEAPTWALTAGAQHFRPLLPEGRPPLRTDPAPSPLSSPKNTTPWPTDAARQLATCARSCACDVHAPRRH